MHNMYAAPSTSEHGKRYLSYRCDNKFCIRKKKAIRSKFILNFIYEFLEKGLNFTETDYNNYYNKISKLTDAKREKLRVQIHSLEGAIKSTTAEIKDRSLALVGTKVSETVRKYNEEEIERLELQKETDEMKVKELREKLTDPEKDKLSLEQFLNLSKNAARIVKSADSVGKDAICRIIFLDFVVDEEKVLSYQAKEPFATMLKSRQFVTSRIAETTLELYDFIINNLDTVDKFNEDISLYLQGKKQFQQPQYLNVML